MLTPRIDSFIAQCSELPGAMSIEYKALSPSIEFSNSGRRGGVSKYFSITIRELLQTFKDIREHIAEFEAISRYNEKSWRELFSSCLTDRSMNALSTVQTKPLYVVLNKVIHVANQLPEPFSDDEADIRLETVEQAIRYLEEILPSDKEYLNSSSVFRDASGQRAQNTIFYGAPGTGKSYTVDQLTKGSNVVRTVFHSETQSTDFIGCLKPHMEEGKVSYSFRPGPFVTALEKAWTEQESHTYLVVEEINRAPAAAVFGEVFQLLDRSDSGQSHYSVTLADMDLVKYLNDSCPGMLSDGDLRIPANMSILATMNSSDQAVLPMDTAFKRRWQFRYVPIDFASAPEGKLSIPTNEGLVDISWKAFAVLINDELKRDIPEDRLLGQHFISQGELLDKDSARDALVGKLFLYLWDDVLRHGQRERIFDLEKAHSIGDLVRRFEQSESIFCRSFEERIIAKSNVESPESQSVADDIDLSMEVPDVISETFDEIAALDDVE